MENLNRLLKGTIAEFLGITFTEVGADYLKGKMPVWERTRQPLHLLHGGAHTVFAETLATYAANLVIDYREWYALAFQTQTHILRSAEEEEHGWVEGVTRLVYQGRRHQLWQVWTYLPSGELCATTLVSIIVRPQDALSRRRKTFE